MSDNSSRLYKALAARSSTSSSSSAPVYNNNLSSSSDSVMSTVSSMRMSTHSTGSYSTQSQHSYMSRRLLASPVESIQQSEYSYPSSISSGGSGAATTCSAKRLFEKSHTNYVDHSPMVDLTMPIDHDDNSILDGSSDRHLSSSLMHSNTLEVDEDDLEEDDDYHTKPSINDLFLPISKSQIDFDLDNALTSAMVQSTLTTVETGVHNQPTIERHLIPPTDLSPELKRQQSHAQRRYYIPPTYPANVVDHSQLPDLDKHRKNGMAKMVRKFAKKIGTS